MTGRLTSVAVIGGLIGSAAALASAPALMPDGYSWLSHTTSESAAQGVTGAWLARLGFLLFGFSVLVLVGVRRRPWGPVASGLHTAFGALMIGAAVFSVRPWLPGVAYDRTEDLLHSVAATAMGFAFAFGVVATLLRAPAAQRRGRWPGDAVAVLASVVLPVAMTVLPDSAGVWQRLMFAIAYLWYAAEAVRGSG